MKSEPNEYSIDDLKRDRVAPWVGVRNYQARNFMRDEMRIGDLILFYHSSCENVGIAGIGKVSSEPYSDATQFERRGKYYDPKATKEKPRWMLVDIRFVKKFKRVIPLQELRQEKPLQNMITLRPGNRLSITAVTENEFQHIEGLI